MIFWALVFNFGLSKNEVFDSYVASQLFLFACTEYKESGFVEEFLNFSSSVKSCPIKLPIS